MINTMKEENKIRIVKWSNSGIPGDNHIMDGRKNVAIAVGYPGISNEELEHNKRLIASAPELLQALQECITEPNAHCLCQDSREALFRRIEAINQTARAAIAKAIGE